MLGGYLSGYWLLGLMPSSYYQFTGGIDWVAVAIQVMTAATRTTTMSNNNTNDSSSSSNTAFASVSCVHERHLRLFQSRILPFTLGRDLRLGLLKALLREFDALLGDGVLVGAVDGLCFEDFAHQARTHGGEDEIEHGAKICAAPQSDAAIREEIEGGRVVVAMGAALERAMERAYNWRARVSSQFLRRVECYSFTTLSPD